MFPIIFLLSFCLIKQIYLVLDVDFWALTFLLEFRPSSCSCHSDPVSANSMPATVLGHWLTLPLYFPVQFTSCQLHLNRPKPIERFGIWITDWPLKKSGWVWRDGNTYRLYFLLDKTSLDEMRNCGYLITRCVFFLTGG
jgi:hypothetical protein